MSVEERLTYNQHSFRSANARLHAALGGVITDGRLVAFLCECADGHCLGRVEMKLSEYDAIHLDRSLYSILPDHPMSRAGHVVEERSSFFIVRKEQEAAA